MYDSPLKTQLDRFVELLGASDEKHWHGYFNSAREMLEKGEVTEAKKKIRGAYGGMCSISDALYFNGLPEAVAQEGFQLRASLHTLSTSAGGLPAGTERSVYGSPPKAIWFLAYLVSPALPFFCLRRAKAIETIECFFGVLVTFVVQLGLMTVLSEIEGDPLQIFVVLLLGLSLYLIVLWQFLAGQRIGLWSADARKQWKLAGRFFGGLIALGLVGGILGFHLQRHMSDPSPHEIENRSELLPMK